MKIFNVVRYTLTLISIIVFIIQASKCIKIFLAKESVSTSRMHNTAHAEFPSITICPDYFEAYNENTIDEFNRTEEDIRHFRYPDTSINSLEFFELITYDLQELMDDLVIYFDEIDPETGEDRRQFSNLDQTYWSQKNWITLGRCYSFNLPLNFRKLKVGMVKVTGKMDLLVYLNHPGQFWWIDTDSKISMPVDQTGFIDVRHSVIYALPTDTGNEEDNKFPICNNDMNYEYDSCFEKKIQSRFLESFGCLHPFFTSGQNESICNIGAMSSFEQKSFYDLHKRLSFHPQGCRSPCATIALNFGVPDTQPRINGTFQYLVYFKRFISVRKETLKYPAESLIAELGGYLGMLLGVSVLDCLIIPRKIQGFLRTLQSVHS